MFVRAVCFFMVSVFSVPLTTKYTANIAFHEILRSITDIEILCSAHMFNSFFKKNSTTNTNYFVLNNEFAQLLSLVVTA